MSKSFLNELYFIFCLLLPALVNIHICGEQNKDEIYISKYLLKHWDCCILNKTLLGFYLSFFDLVFLYLSQLNIWNCGYIFMPPVMTYFLSGQLLVTIVSFIKIILSVLFILSTSFFSISVIFTAVFLLSFFHIHIDF